MNEIKRVFHKKYALFVAALLILNACVLIYKTRGNAECSKVYDRLILLAQDCKQDGQSCREAMTEAWKIYALQNGVDRDTITDAQKEARTMAFEKAQYLDGYAQLLQERIDNASRILNSGIYAKDSFEHINLAKNRYDLRRLLNGNPGFSNGIWLEQLYNHHDIQIFVMLLLCITVYGFFLERKNGLYELIHAGAQGRLRLFLKRGAILAAQAAVTSALFYAESAVILLTLHGGVEGLGAPALEDEVFLLTSADLSRLALLGVMALLCALSALALAMLLWLTLSFFSNVNIGIFIFLLLCGLDALLYFVISPKAVLRAFHYLNVYYLLYPIKALEYRNWGYSFGIVRLLDGTVFLAVVSGLTALAVNLYVNVRHYYSGRQNLLERALYKLQEMGMQVVSKLPVVGKELYKILISQRSLLILAVLCVVIIRMDAGHLRLYNLFEGSMLKYYEKADGMEYGAELEKIYADYQADYETAMAQLDMNNERDQQQASSMAQVLSAIRGHVDYLRSQQESGIAAVAVSPYEYEEIYGQKQAERQRLVALVNILAVVVISAGFLSYERKSGIYPLAFSCFGRKKWLARKLLVSLGLIALFEGLTYGIYYWKLAQIYHFDYLSAPLKSLPMFADYPFNPSILGFIVIDLLIRFIFLAALSVCISAISCHISYLYCAFLGLITALPQFLYMLGFRGLDFLSPVNYAAFFPLYQMGAAGLNAYKAVLVVFVAGNIFLLERIVQRTAH